MTLDHHVSKSADEVFACLTDAAQFVAVHPVIYRLEALDATRYRVFERLPLLPFSFTYPATISGLREAGEVRMEATVGGGLVHIGMRFTITPHGAGCVVREDVTFRTWLPVRAVLERLFQRLHRQLFVNIANAR